MLALIIIVSVLVYAFLGVFSFNVLNELNWFVKRYNGYPDDLPGPILGGIFWPVILPIVWFSYISKKIIKDYKKTIEDKE